MNAVKKYWWIPVMLIIALWAFSPKDKTAPSNQDDCAGKEPINGQQAYDEKVDQMVEIISNNDSWVASIQEIVDRGGGSFSTLAGGIDAAAEGWVAQRFCIV